MLTPPGLVRVCVCAQVPDYLLRVEKRFEEEVRKHSNTGTSPPLTRACCVFIPLWQSDRVGAYLDHTTRRPLIVVLEQQMLQSQAAALLDKGAAPARCWLTQTTLL